MGRFNKAGGKRRGPNYQGRGRGRDGNNSNNKSAVESIHRGQRRNNNNNVGTSSTGRVIDKLQSRVTKHQQTIQQQVPSPLSSAAVTKHSQVRIATTEEALQYLDKRKLDEVAVCEETQTLIATLLQELGIVENESGKNSTENANEDEEEVDDASDQDDEVVFSHDQWTEDHVDDEVMIEQSESRRVNGIDEHVLFLYEDMDVDDCRIRSSFKEGDDEELSSPIRDIGSQSCDNENHSKHDKILFEESKTFLYLTQQLSFSKEQALRACNAIDGWDEALTKDRQNNYIGSSTSNVGNATTKTDKMLEVAMDWLCLHLSQEELSQGFRPNPKPPNQRKERSDKCNGVKLKAVPHPSITVDSKPIAEQAKEWTSAVRLQERTMALVRLGFHHSEALQACEQTHDRVSNTSNEHFVSNSAVYDPAVSLLLTKLNDEVSVEVEPKYAMDATGFSSEEHALLLEERAQELEALEAIYGDQFRIVYKCIEWTPSNMDERSSSIWNADHYVIAINPVEELQAPARADDSELHVFLTRGYPLHSTALFLVVNLSLPPTLLRRMNVLLLKNSQKLLGNPAVFDSVSLVENELPMLYNDFIDEQRRMEFDAQQVRILRQKEEEIERAQKIMDAQYDAQYDPKGEGAKLGRRRRAKLKAAERAYVHEEITEQLYKDYRHKQDARVEHAQTQNKQIRAMYAELAIQRRQEEIIQEEIEQAARSATSASLNRGESLVEARQAANHARQETLRKIGIDISDDNAGGVDASTESRNVSSCQRHVEEDEYSKPKPTAKSSQFLEQLGNSSLESSSPVATSDVPQKCTPTQKTLAFMDRLREMYENAAKEKVAGRSYNENEPCSPVPFASSKVECYHLKNPSHVLELEKDQPSSPISLPRPVAVPAGELVEVMNDIIDQQISQPWLVSCEARAPTAYVGKREPLSNDRQPEIEISRQLREDLELKRTLATESEHGNTCGVYRNGNHRFQRLNGFSPQLYYSMMKVRESLPAYKMKKEVVETILSNQITVIAGATGCGKTTQVPQLVLDDLILKGQGATANIIVTQPRRISAIGVSERIAQERSETVGETCGYSIKLEKKVSSRTRLLLCTTGVLLRRLQCDPDLAAVSHIFVDEVHERDLNTDFLIIILKDLLQRRKQLKLVLMSATLNAESFSKYFDGCPVVSIPGRAFPVEEYRLEDILEMTRYQVTEGSDYAQKRSDSQPPKMSKSALRKLYYPRYSKETIHSLSIVDETVINYELIAALLEHISNNQAEGAILVFCPGFQEIQKTIEEMYKKEYFQSSNVVIYPLHSTLSTADQTAIFHVPQPGVRKIVVSTNIAETSITIEDVVFVVDTGRVKENRRDEVNGTPTLEECWVSRASAKQRRGRAGRVRPGIAYHLFSSHTHDFDFQEYQLPEMLRVGIEDLVLQILILDLGEPTNFLKKALDPPTDIALSNSLKLLEQLGAVDCKWERGRNIKFEEPSGEEKKDCDATLDVSTELTALGYHLATLPVDPRIGKMIIYSSLFGCVDPILTLAASMSSRSPFVSPFDLREQADAARKKFSVDNSDHLTILNAFDEWSIKRKSKNNKVVQSFLKDHFLSKPTLLQMEELRKQFHSLLMDIGFLSRDLRLKDMHHSANKNAKNEGLLKAVLCAGLYPNILIAPKSVVWSACSKPGDKKLGEVSFCSHSNGDVYLHPSTIAFGESYLYSRYCCFHELIRTSKTYVRDCTAVSPFALLLFGGALEVYQTHGICSIDGWLKFRINAKPATLIKYLRATMERILFDKIVSPEKDVMATNEGQAVIHAISSLFTSEGKQITQTNIQIAHQSDGEIVRPWTGDDEDTATSQNHSRRGLRRRGPAWSRNTPK